MKAAANMTIEEREKALAEALVVCDRVMKDAYMRRAMKQAVLEEEVVECDFDLKKSVKEE
jgi:hypothetical protein